MSKKEKPKLPKKSPLRTVEDALAESKQNKKKRNTRAIGQKHVKEAIEIFESMGFTCWKPGNKAHFIGPGRVVSQSQDIFEAFDIVATRSHLKPHFIQVTTASPVDKESAATKRRKKVKKVPLSPEHTVCMVLARAPRKKWICWALLDGKWIRSGVLGEKALCDFILGYEINRLFTGAVRVDSFFGGGPNG